MYLFEIEDEIKGLINARATETRIIRFNTLARMLRQYNIMAISRKYLFSLFMDEIKEINKYKKIKMSINRYLIKSNLEPIGNNTFLLKLKGIKIYIGIEENKAVFLKYYYNSSCHNLFFYL